MGGRDASDRRSKRPPIRADDPTPARAILPGAFGRGQLPTGPGARPKNTLYAIEAAALKPAKKYGGGSKCYRAAA